MPSPLSSNQPAAAPCSICEEAADDANSAICSRCGRRFHLVLSNAQSGKDCGRVWVNEEFLALEFGCLTCLQETSGIAPAPPAAPPVDATEGIDRPARRRGIRAREVVRRKRR